MRTLLNKFISNWNKILLSLIIIIGFLFRVYGYNWGFPLLFHPDEPAITEQAFQLIKKGSLEPTFFGRPNHLSIYIHSGLYELVSPIIFKGQSPKTTFENNRPFFYGISRILTVIIGTTSIVIAYLIGLQFSLLIAFISAGIYAIFPLYILHAHYVTPDVSITFLTLLTIYYSLKYLKENKNKSLVLLGIVAGLSIAEKYPGIANLVMACLVISIKNIKDVKKIINQLVKIFIIFCTSLFLSAPFLFIRFNKVIQGFITESRTSHLGQQILGFYGNSWFYLRIFYENGGLVLSLFSLMGLMFIVKNKGKILYLPLFLGVFYWIGLSKIALHWDRWGLPMYITPLFLASIGIEKLIASFYKKKLIIIFISLFIFISIYNQLSLSTYNLKQLTAKDTRVLALEYLNNNGINKNNSVYEGYTPFANGITGNTKYNFKELENKKYVILSSWLYGRYLKEDKDGKYKNNIKFYNQVSKYILLKRFNSKCKNTTKNINFLYKINIKLTIKDINENCIMGPEIKIYKLNFY